MSNKTTFLNISSTSADWRGLALSNFGLSPFVFHDMLFASVEGFIQGIKFPESDPRRLQAFHLSGWDAKQLGDLADRSGVYWNRQCLPYGSTQHHQLIESAIRARIDQSIGLQRALLSTNGLDLVHDTGRAEAPTTSLPAIVFCRILTAIREELLCARLAAS
ncbi:MULTISPECIES: hypothetical protein [Pseudomonas]|uniref:hypothetical protein n=1 Tax=Pseudomonas TaxID=286 RepID=UPI0005BCB1C9|nr:MULTISPECIES: hypothetical protein [Pseudomonas]MBM2595934.1 hypothetical protein [Pseudomonas sp. BDPW]